MAKPKRPLLRWLLLSIIPLLWCALSAFGLLELLENRLIDMRFRYRGELDAPVKIVYVDIDTDAIQQYGFPLNHTRYAQLLEALFAHGHVKAVGFDLVLSENGLPDWLRKEMVPGRIAFGQAVRKYQNVVLGANYVPGPGRLQEVRRFPFIFDGLTDSQKNDIPEVAGFPILGPTWGIVGLIDTYRGETRASPFFAETPQTTFYPLSLRMALIEWGVGTDAIRRFPDRLEIRRSTEELITSIPLVRGQLVEVNWFSHWISQKNPRCSFANIGDYLTQLESDDPAKQERGKQFFAQFKDAIVLVGPVDNLLQDLSRTSFDDMPVPQVGFHGNMLKTLVSGKYLRHLPPWLEYALIFALTGAVAQLAASGGTRTVRYKLLAGLVLLVYVALAFEVFARSQLIVPIMAPLGAAFTTSFGSIVWQLVEEQKQKSRIKGMFGTYVSPELVNRMIDSGEDPKLGGAEAEITAYFSDIQNFSTFSELLSPTQLVELMNEYLTVCTDIVTAQGGTLDKYIGDAVVAMFGAPLAFSDHAYRACIASQLVQQGLSELRKRWTSEGDKWPPLVARMHTRIGLNSGAAVVGNMGSLTRFNYTMMGDNVNLAARMESGAKNYGASTLATEATKRAAELAGDRCVFRFLDRIVVKGRGKPVAIFEIVGLKENIPPSTRDCIEIFTTGIEYYLRQDWAAAAALFRRSGELEPGGGEGEEEHTPSRVYYQRCETMKISPPEKNWDGVYVMRTK